MKIKVWHSGIGYYIPVNGKTYNPRTKNWPKIDTIIVSDSFSDKPGWLDPAFNNAYDRAMNPQEY